MLTVHYRFHGTPAALGRRDTRLADSGCVFGEHRSAAGLPRPIGQQAASAAAEWAGCLDRGSLPAALSRRGVARCGEVSPRSTYTPQMPHRASPRIVGSHPTVAAPCCVGAIPLRSDSTAEKAAVASAPNPGGDVFPDVLG